MANVYIVLNAVLYCGLLLFLLKKKFDILHIYTASFYVLCAFCGIIHYNIGLFQYHNITLFPFIYLFAFIIIAFYPIFSSSPTQIETIETNDRLLKIITLFIIFLSVIPFIENLMLLGNITNQSDYMTSMYDSTHGSDGKSQVVGYSYFGNKMMNLCKNLANIIPIAFFYYLSKKKLNKWLIMGIALSLINLYLNSYVTASRSTIVREIIYLIFVYFLFKNNIADNIKKKIKFYFLIIFSFLLFVLIVISIARFSSMYENNNRTEMSMFAWLIWYAGESMLNFNEYVWSMDSTMSGNCCFSLFLDFMGYDTFFDTTTRRFYWEMKTGIPQYIFYTFIGNFVEDFGKIGGGIFVLVLSLILKKYMRLRKSTSLSTIIIYCTWGKVCLLGFTFYSYPSYSAYVLIFSLFVSFVLSFHPHVKNITI